MSDAWRITITPIPKSEDCTINTSDGQEFTVRGLAIFADGGDGHLFTYTWNSPEKAASGCYRACAEAIRNGNLFVVSFYKCLLRMFAMGTGADGTKQVSADELLRRWDAEDTYKAVQADEKKFN